MKSAQGSTETKTKIPRVDVKGCWHQKNIGMHRNLGRSHRNAKKKNGGFNPVKPKFLVHLFLVGGWTNPSEKYARQNGFIFPNFRGEHKKISETTT